MDQPVVINGLSRKRAELSAAIIAAERRVLALRESLAHLDATIKLFDPEAKPAKIRPRTKRGPLRFKAGEFTKIVLAILRDADRPMTAGEIAARVAAEHDLDVSTPKAKSRVVSLVRAALARPRDGLAKTAAGGDLLTWAAG